jgi:3-oxoacyl-[acyl-carrier protein] reductase
VDLGLAGKVALVGGSSRGLGRAVADELAAEGTDLVLCARGADALDRAASEIRTATGVRVEPVAVDLATPSGVRIVADAAFAAFGKIDVLVTNTGGPPAGAFEAHSLDVWRAAYANLLESVVALTQAFLPGMKQRGWGRIINITSIAVKQPVDHLILSNSLRAAVTGFARTLANETAPFGVTVNNVMPGYTRTERLEELASHTARSRGIDPAERLGLWNQEIPLRRIGEPRELAAVVAFLASERASYVTGTSIQVDGGWIRSLL